MYRGRVEVLYNGIWGRICGGERWRLTESNVVCRQLGYDGALVEAYSGGGFDEDAGVIGLTGVKYVGDETSISNCTSRGVEWGVVRYCQGAGVMCTPPGKKMTGTLYFLSPSFLFVVVFFLMWDGFHITNSGCGGSSFSCMPTASFRNHSISKKTVTYHF